MSDKQKSDRVIAYLETCSKMIDRELGWREGSTQLRVSTDVNDIQFIEPLPFKSEPMTATEVEERSQEFWDRMAVFGSGARGVLAAAGIGGLPSVEDDFDSRPDALFVMGDAIKLTLNGKDHGKEVRAGVRKIADMLPDGHARKQQLIDLCDKADAKDA